MSKKKIQDLKFEIKKLLGEIEYLKKENSNLKKDISDLESDNDDIEEELEKLKEKLNNNYLLNLYPRNLANESFIEDLQDYINKKGIKEIKKLIDDEREFEKDFWSE